MKKICLILCLVLGTGNCVADGFQACIDANSRSDHNTSAICDSALESPTLTQDQRSRIQITKANYLIRTHQLNEAEQLLDEAFNLNPIMLENGRYRYNWLRTKGKLYFGKNEYTRALPFFMQALEVARIMGDSSVIATAYNDLGAINMDMNRYDQALDWLQKSLAIQNQLESHYGIAFVLANIAEVYLKLDEPEKAIEYFYLSLESHETSQLLDQKSGTLYETAIAQVYLSLGSLQTQLGQFTEASTHLNEALKIYQQHQLSDQQVMVLSSLGKLQAEQGNIDQAFDFFAQATAIESKLDAQDNLQLKINQIDAYIKSSQWQQAEELAVKGLQQAVEKNTIGQQIEFLNQLALIHQQTNRFATAIKFISQSHAFSEQILQAKYNQSRGNLLAEIELNQKQRELIKLEKQQHQNELERKSQLMIFLTVGLLLLCSIIYLLYLLKRKGQLRRSIKSDQAAHNNQLNLLNINQSQIKQLFDGIQGRYVCFDSTGQIFHYSDDLTDAVSNHSMQKDFEDVWHIILSHLEEDESLSTDLHEQLNSELADHIWVHQLSSLDNMLVCLFLHQNDRNGLNSAEQIKNYSAFKKQLSLVLSNTEHLSIRKANQLSAMTASMKAVNTNIHPPTQLIFSQDEFKKQLVDLMITCVEFWQNTTGKTNVELAEESRIWLVSVEDGHLRTRTMDRYTDINKIPDNPRWRQVIKTAHFILSYCQLGIQDRGLLNAKTERVKALLRHRAMGN